ncbi:MAG TPA: hypothetical protein VGE59_04030 [Patescibacteria group bacterium]
MIQTLKLYSQLLLQQLVDRIARKQVFTLRAAYSKPSHAPYQELDYTQSNRAVLITELDEYGDETPVAVAFLKDSEVVVRKLAELCEAE